MMDCVPLNCKTNKPSLPQVILATEQQRVTYIPMNVQTSLKETFDSNVEGLVLRLYATNL